MRDTPAVARLLTLEEYLALEEQSPVKHEYIAGEVFAMSGVTTRHNLITLNIVTALRAVARRRGCRTFATDVKLKAAKDRVYYPDLIIVCGRAGEVELIVDESSIVVEVTSRSTRAIDRREKLDAYQRVPSLRAGCGRNGGIGRAADLIGSVGDVKLRGLERTNEPQVYLPASQPPENSGMFYAPKDLVIRSSRSPASLLPAIRDAVRRVDPDQPLTDVRPMNAVPGDQTVTRRAQLRILIALAALALLLAGVGIHGLLAFTVAQRSQEIGVRLALGAEPSRMAQMIVSEAVRTAAIGVVPGIFAAYAAARAMNSLLFGVRPNDPWTFSVAALVCLVVVVLGCVRPAVRAARVNPLTALRAD